LFMVEAAVRYDPIHEKRAKKVATLMGRQRNATFGVANLGILLRNVGPRRWQARPT
jgi:hypothetical protein